MKSIYKNKRGFTLIELLVVIVVLGVLFVVLMSQIDFSTDKAKVTGVQTDFRAFQVAVKQVALEQQGFPDDQNILWEFINNNLSPELQFTFTNLSITSLKRDPWGTQYIANYSQPENTRGRVEIRSAGLDTLSYTEDDYVIVITYSLLYDGGQILIESTFNGYVPEKESQPLPPIENAHDLLAGLYQYKMGSYVMTYSWEELLSQKLIFVEHGTLLTQYDSQTDDNASAQTLDGLLVLSSDVKVLGTDAFRGCNKINAMVLPGSILMINDGAFEGCSKMKRSYYQGTLENWCKIQFAKYDSTPLWNDGELYIDNQLLSGDIVIPETIHSIGAYTFFKAENITSLRIHSNVSSMGKNAIWGCTNIKKVYYEGDIGHWLDIDFDYNGNPLLYNAELYAKDELVTKIVIPDGSIKIKQYMFDGCSSIQEVYIPASLQEIEMEVFCTCLNLHLIVYDGTIDAWNSIPKGEYWNAYMSNYTIRCSDGEIVFINGIKQ